MLLIREGSLLSLLELMRLGSKLSSGKVFCTLQSREGGYLNCILIAEKKKPDDCRRILKSKVETGEGFPK